MAKKKTTTRKSTRHSTYPHRNNSSTTNNKAASVSPSNASSPSPPPDNSSASSPAPTPSSCSSIATTTNLNGNSSSRRKGLPRRSLSQNDPSKGIVFSFRFQNDPGLSMAVDIRSYDQQFGPSESSCAAALKVGEETNSKTVFSAGSLPVARSPGINGMNDTIHNSMRGSVRMNGDHWSSDPTAYRNSNVYDQTRNLLILHTRKPPPHGGSQGIATVAVATAESEIPQASTAYNTIVEPLAKSRVATSTPVAAASNVHPVALHPYRVQRRSSSSSLSAQSQSSLFTSSFPSTPALSQSGSSTSSTSSSPSSPTPPHSLTSSARLQPHTKCGVSDTAIPLTLEALSNAQSMTTRFLNVRGLGGASRGRRMQVILVS